MWFILNPCRTCQTTISLFVFFFRATHGCDDGPLDVEVLFVSSCVLFLCFLHFRNWLQRTPVKTMDIFEYAQVARELYVFDFCFLYVLFLLFSIYFQNGNRNVIRVDAVRCWCADRPFASSCSLKPGAAGRYYETATRFSCMWHDSHNNSNWKWNWSEIRSLGSDAAVLIVT